MRPAERLDHVPTKRLGVLREAGNALVGLECHQQRLAFFDEDGAVPVVEPFGIAVVIDQI